MSPELMEQLAQVPASDPGLQALLSKYAGDRIKNLERQARRDMEARREAERADAEDAAEAAAAAAGKAPAGDLGEDLLPPRGGARDLSQLRRAG